MQLPVIKLQWNMHAKNPQIKNNQATDPRH